jgi:ankyrin repeat protein
MRMARQFLSILGFAGLLAAGARPPILEAARNGDKSAIRTLISKKADVNAPDGDGSTALHWASYRDDGEAADLLIRAGANANAANDLGATPLWAAAQNGSAAMVRRLLAAGADPNLALLSGETPLMVAARGGYSEVAEQLLSRGANVNAKGTRDQTALMWAVSQKHPEVVRVLLQHNADIFARSQEWTYMMAVPPHGFPENNKLIPHGGETALMFAARVGDFESAKMLVAAGANVNDTDAWGVSALTLAAHSAFDDIVYFLLEKGADPNLAKPGFTALHIAIIRRDEQMARALLDHGANPNTPLTTWTPTRRSSKDYHFEPALVGATPFWLAARFTEPAVMRMLVELGADPLFVQHSESYSEQRYTRRSEVTTALMAALGMGGGAPWVAVPRAQREPLALETVKLAVELGVNVNAENLDGRTALDAARALKYESVVKFLTEKGARPGNTKAAAPQPD